MGEYDALKLENQLCFPLYACSREVIKKYKVHLDRLNLTYTQYITMLVVWEQKSITVKMLGDILYLDSGTLTPLLKKLESKGLIKRTRSTEDERNLIISVTPEGEALKEQAKMIPEEMKKHLNLDRSEIEFLYRILYKMLRDDEE